MPAKWLRKGETPMFESVEHTRCILVLHKFGYAYLLLLPAQELSRLPNHNRERVPYTDTKSLIHGTFHSQSLHVGNKLASPEHCVSRALDKEQIRDLGGNKRDDVEA